MSSWPPCISEHSVNTECSIYLLLPLQKSLQWIVWGPVACALVSGWQQSVLCVSFRVHVGTEHWLNLFHMVFERSKLQEIEVHTSSSPKFQMYPITFFLVRFQYQLWSSLFNDWSSLLQKTLLKTWQMWQFGPRRQNFENPGSSYSKICDILATPTNHSTTVCLKYAQTTWCMSRKL